MLFLLSIVEFQIRKPNVDVRIHLHEQHQFLDFTGRMGHEINRGEKITAQINIHDVEQLEREFHDPHSSDHQPGGIAQEYSTTCSAKHYDECIYNQLTKRMLKESETNCVVPWFPGNYTVCTQENDINTTFSIYWNRITNQLNDCNTPCKSTVLNIAGKNYRKDNSLNYGTGIFYFSATSTQSKEHYLYTFTSMVAEIGGYLGLLLGYSCLDLASAIRDASQKRHMRKIKTST